MELMIKTQKYIPIHSHTNILDTQENTYTHTNTGTRKRRHGDTNITIWTMEKRMSGRAYKQESVYVLEEHR